jgi:hypothetical protein
LHAWLTLGWKFRLYSECAGKAQGAATPEQELSAGYGEWVGCVVQPADSGFAACPASLRGVRTKINRKGYSSSEILGKIESYSFAAF